MSFPYRQIHLCLMAITAIWLFTLALNARIWFRPFGPLAIGVEQGVDDPLTHAVKETVPPRTITEPVAWSATAFDILRPSSGMSLPDRNGDGGKPEWAKRFRLLGTVLGVATTGPRQPLAILHDSHSVSGGQRVIRPGDRIEPDIRVERILAQQVILRKADLEQVRLHLRTSGADDGRIQETARVPVGRVSDSDIIHDTAGAFGGTRLGDTDQWMFERERLMQYYAELRDNPERMLAVFDSMKPVYEPDGSISGYRLHIEGEAAFFEAVGLEQGDVVRSVNNVPMSSRRHAEHFIARVVADGLDTVAMSIERNGQARKFVYMFNE